MTNPTKLAVIGSREFRTKDLFMKGLHEFMLYHFTDSTQVTFVSGGAQGPDTWAEEYAKHNSISIVVYRPNYNKYAGEAPFQRNVIIARECDLIFAAWDQVSKGTEYTIKEFQGFHRKTKPVYILSEMGFWTQYAVIQHLHRVVR